MHNNSVTSFGCKSNSSGSKSSGSPVLALYAQQHGVSVVDFSGRESLCYMHTLYWISVFKISSYRMHSYDVYEGYVLCSSCTSYCRRGNLRRHTHLVSIFSVA